MNWFIPGINSKFCGAFAAVGAGRVTSKLMSPINNIASIKNIPKTVRGIPIFAKTRQNFFGFASLSNRSNPRVVLTIRRGPKALMPYRSRMPRLFKKITKSQ
jgi:hypothetical protein